MIYIRIWHQKLIPFLPRQQLLGAHRECCALRGAGWGRRHSVVNYVFNYSPNRLIAYHHLIMEEMERRGYHSDPIWYQVDWRGTRLGEEKGWGDEIEVNEIKSFCRDGSAMIYSEHNSSYLEECLENLRGKGIEINGQM